jgi:hypothetical protein
VNRRSQRGTIDNSPLLWIVPILALIAWYKWPGGPPDLFGIAATTWFTWIAWIGGSVLVLMVIVGFVVRRREARDLERMNEVARVLGSELDIRFSGGWGRSTIVYSVNYARAGRAVTVYPVSGATAANLDVAGAHAVPFSLTFEKGAATVTEHGPGPSRSGEFLDAGVRASLERMERIGEDRYRAVTIIVAPDSVLITKHGRISPGETLLFLDLAWPVFDRALAACFGQPAALPVEKPNRRD